MQTEKEKRAKEKAWRQAHPEKSREYSRRYYANNREKERARNKRWYTDNPEWQKEWNKANPEKLKQKRERYLSKPENAAKSAEACKKWRESEAGKNILRNYHREHQSIPEYRIRRLLNSARARAVRIGRAFDDNVFSVLINIPKNCACCSADFDYTVLPPGESMFNASREGTIRSPSIDRIDNNKGYTLDNIAITCSRCNFVRSNATLEEHKMLIDYIEREMLPGIKTCHRQQGDPVLPRRAGMRSHENRMRFLLQRARIRARKNKLIFDESLFNILTIPTRCSCCNIELDRTLVPNATFIASRRGETRSPSLDRLNSKKGYTVDNIAVVCAHCNFIKSDATLEELKLLVAYEEREMLARGLI